VVEKRVRTKGEKGDYLKTEPQRPSKETDRRREKLKVASHTRKPNEGKKTYVNSARKKKT